MSDTLASWNSGAAKDAVVEFVDRVTRDGSPDFVPEDERVAVFDNDGTLWCEKPVPIQAHFILRHFREMAEKDPALREKQPWKAAYEKDVAWLGSAVDEHYNGDDSKIKLLIGGILQALAGVDVENYQRHALEFVTGTEHPTKGRLYSECIYQPMVELLRYLDANGFRNYIASGGDRDFMRPFARPLYGIPPQRVIGTSFGLTYQENETGGAMIYKSSLEFFDDGPEKPVRIWNRIGQRPIIAGGNSNGDIPMLQFAGGSRPALRLLVLHDDAEREFDYVKGAERSLELAKEKDWTVVSVKKDWATVFADSG